LTKDSTILTISSLLGTNEVFPFYLSLDAPFVRHLQTCGWYMRILWASLTFDIQLWQTDGEIELSNCGLDTENSYKQFSSSFASATTGTGHWNNTEK
jgi:hypothetical protein